MGIEDGGGADDNDEGGEWMAAGSLGDMHEASSSGLVAAPRQVVRIGVTYAKAAKQVQSSGSLSLEHQQKVLVAI